jgi:hypothetical protein
VEVNDVGLPLHRRWDTTELVRRAFLELRMTEALVHGGTPLHGDLPDGAAVGTVLDRDAGVQSRGQARWAV